MHDQQANLGCLLEEPAPGQRLAEVQADLPHKGEAPQGHGDTPLGEGEGPGLVEDMQQRVAAEQGTGDAAALMVSGDQRHLDTALCQLQQGLQGQLHQARVRISTVEQITTMNDQVHLAAAGRLQCQAVVAHKIVATAAALDPWAPGQVEPDMGVGQEQDAEHSLEPAQAPC